MTEAAALAKDLAAVGVAGVMITWADNNGIPRARVVPVEGLPDATERGVGVTTLFAVFDTHDAITFAHPGLSTPSGDVRLLPVIERLTRLAGQPALAWAPGRQVAADGSSWPYDQRGALEAQVDRATELGFELRAGYEMEFVVGSADADPAGGVSPAHHGPAYSPHALLAVDEFVGALLADLAVNGVPVNQLHAEFGVAQMEVSIAASDPVTAADRQLLARQTIHAAARAHGLRASFAPLITLDGVGNGWHLHTSVWREGENLLAGDATRGPTGEGAGYLAGLLRDLPALAAITAPSVPSLTRLRPGWPACRTRPSCRSRSRATRASGARRNAPATAWRGCPTPRSGRRRHCWETSASARCSGTSCSARSSLSGARTRRGRPSAARRRSSPRTCGGTDQKYGVLLVAPAARTVRVSFPSRSPPHRGRARCSPRALRRRGGSGR